MMKPADLGKPTGRIYYRCVDACGWLPADAALNPNAFRDWPKQPELWEEREFGAWKI